MGGGGDRSWGEVDRGCAAQDNVVGHDEGANQIDSLRGTEGKVRE